MFFLYNLLLTFSSPFWAPWMVWRARQRKEQPNWKERQGDYREAVPKKGERPRIWVHTVSVGEFMAAQPFLRELKASLPQYEVVVSVTTSSGHATAEQSPELYDFLVYLPIDVVRFTLNAMQRVRPAALIVFETELWYNLFWAAKTFDTKIFVVNARLSDRSYPTARKLGFFYKTLLGMVDGVFAQSETDAERFTSLGASQVKAVGNVKFDQALSELDRSGSRDWSAELGLAPDKPVLVVGSVRSEEFGFVAEALRPLVDQVQIVLAPRHIERTPELVAALSGVAVGYRSKGETLPPGGVLILDSYGELASLYSVADLAIIGGGFAALGGQNLIQPLAFGKPVLHGPYMKNFRDVAALAARDGATTVCKTPTELRDAVVSLLADSDRRTAMGTAARALVKANEGAAKRMVRELSERGL